MAHEIDMTGAQPAIAYVGQVPWHGLGAALPEDTPLEQWRIAAGMDWHLNSSDVYADGNIKIPNHKALLRSDTNKPLAVVSDHYNVVQPEEILNFFKDLIDNGGFKLHTAGVLQEGRKFWALAKTQVQIKILGNDVLDNYLLLATSCDRSMATRAQFTSVRVVCANTLAMSISEAKRGRKNAISVGHYREFDPKQVKFDLGLAQETAGRFEEDATKMAKISFSREDAIKFFGEIILGDKVANMSVDELQQNASYVGNLYATYKNGPGATLVSANDTLWGAVNAVTHYVDHLGRRRTQDARLNSIWFGNGAQIKGKTWDKALALAA